MDSHKSERFDLTGSGGQSSGMKARLQYTDESTAMPVRIKNISPAGARIIVDGMPRKHATVILTFQGRGNASVHATIRWVRPLGLGRWFVGCKFDEPLGDDFFGRGLRAERLATRVTFTVRRQLSQSTNAEATVINHSDGGICIHANEPFTAGENLMLERKDGDNHVRFLTRVKWVQSNANCHLAGCQFARPLDRFQFQQTVETRPVSKELPSRDVNATPPGVLAGCVVVYAWSALHLAGHWPPFN